MQRLRDDLLTGLLFQNIAEKYFEYVKEEAEGEGKNFINQLINRLRVNRNNCYSRITTDAGRDAFVQEFSKKDALQYANIFLTLMDMKEEDRDRIERITTAISKGEMVEIYDSQVY